MFTGRNWRDRQRSSTGEDGDVDVVFKKVQLGISLKRSTRGMMYVHRVEPGGEADRQGVLPGDEVAYVLGHNLRKRLVSTEQWRAVVLDIRDAPRPLRMTIRRPPEDERIINVASARSRGGGDSSCAEAQQPARGVFGSLFGRDRRAAPRPTVSGSRVASDVSLEATDEHFAGLLSPTGRTAASTPSSDSIKRRQGSRHVEQVSGFLQEYAVSHLQRTNSHETEQIAAFTKEHDRNLRSYAAELSRENEETSPRSPPGSPSPALQRLRTENEALRDQIRRMQGALDRMAKAAPAADTHPSLGAPLVPDDAADPRGRRGLARRRKTTDAVEGRPASPPADAPRASATPSEDLGSDRTTMDTGSASASPEPGAKGAEGRQSAAVRLFEAAGGAGAAEGAGGAEGGKNSLTLVSPSGNPNPGAGAKPSALPSAPAPMLQHAWRGDGAQRAQRHMRSASVSSDASSTASTPRGISQRTRIKRRSSVGAGRPMLAEVGQLSSESSSDVLHSPSALMEVSSRMSEHADLNSPRLLNNIVELGKLVEMSPNATVSLSRPGSHRSSGLRRLSRSALTMRSMRQTSGSQLDRRSRADSELRSIASGDSPASPSPAPENAAAADALEALESPIAVTSPALPKAHSPQSRSLSLFDFKTPSMRSSLTMRPSASRPPPMSTDDAHDLLLGVSTRFVDNAANIDGEGHFSTYACVSACADVVSLLSLLRCALASADAAEQEPAFSFFLPAAVLESFSPGQEAEEFVDEMVRFCLPTQEVAFVISPALPPTRASPASCKNDAVHVLYFTDQDGNATHGLCHRTLATLDGRICNAMDDEAEHMFAGGADGAAVIRTMYRAAMTIKAFVLYRCGRPVASLRHRALRRVDWLQIHIETAHCVIGEKAVHGFYAAMLEVVAACDHRHLGSIGRPEASPRVDSDPKAAYDAPSIRRRRIALEEAREDFLTRMHRFDLREGKSGARKKTGAKGPRGMEETLEREEREARVALIGNGGSAMAKMPAPKSVVTVQDERVTGAGLGVTLQLPCVPCHLWAAIPLLCMLSPLVLTKSLRLLLLERSLTVCCPDAVRLSSIVVGLHSLLSPFKWCGTIIPLLPLELIEMLHSPAPLIAGVCFSKERVLQEETSNLNLLVVGSSPSESHLISEKASCAWADAGLLSDDSLEQTIHDAQRALAQAPRRGSVTSLMALMPSEAESISSTPFASNGLPVTHNFSSTLTRLMRGLTLREQRAAEVLQGGVIEHHKRICGDLARSCRNWKKYGIYDREEQQFFFQPELFLMEMNKELAFRSSVVSTQCFVEFVELCRVQAEADQEKESSRAEAAPTPKVMEEERPETPDNRVPFSPAAVDERGDGKRFPSAIAI